MNHTMTPSVGITAPTYCSSRPSRTATGSRRVSSHDTANIPGGTRIPPWGSRIGPRGWDPSRIASVTAAALARRSGSADSMTAFVMNHPTLSCHRSS